MTGLGEIWRVAEQATMFCALVFALTVRVHQARHLTVGIRSIWSVLCLALLTTTAPRVLGGVFEDANRAYEQGNFPEAIRLYETMLKSGHHSPGVLFNLGNACFRNGEIGRAIYNYRRAARIAPRDPDVLANLRFARESVTGTNSIQPSFFAQLLSRFSLNEIAVVTTALFWVWMGLLCFSRVRPASRRSLRVWTVLSASLTLLLLLILLAARSVALQRTAIVATSQAQVRLGPLEESQPAFTVNNGTELRLLAERESWIQVADRSGRTGWLNTTDVLLFPPVKSGSN